MNRCLSISAINSNKKEKNAVEIRKMGKIYVYYLMSE